eukprot:g5062.t1
MAAKKFKRVTAEEEKLIVKLSTPRIAFAAEKCGYEKKELQRRAIHTFVDKKQTSDVKLRNQLAVVKYKRFEDKRQMKMREIWDMREEIIRNECNSRGEIVTNKPPPKKLEGFGHAEKMKVLRKSRKGGESSMVKAEKVRMKAIKDRQKREIEGVIAFEKMMSKLTQEAVLKREKEAAEARRLATERKKRQILTATLRRNREIERQERLDEERRMARKKAQEDYLERKRERAEKARKFKKAQLERRKRDAAAVLARIKKAKDAEARELEERQQLIEKVAEMDRANDERLQRIAEQNRRLRIARQKFRDKSKVRIQKALERDAAKQKKIVDDYEEKQRLAEVFRKKMEKVKKKEIEEHRKFVAAEAEHRRKKFLAAEAIKAKRIQNILDKRAAKEKRIAEERKMREQERLRKKVLADLRLQDKLDNVRKINRMKECKARLLGIKNQKKTHRTTKMLDQKEAMKQARLLSGIKLWKDKEDLCNEIEKLRRNQKWSALDVLVSNMENEDEYDSDDMASSQRGKKGSKKMPKNVQIWHAFEMAADDGYLPDVKDILHIADDVWNRLRKNGLSLSKTKQRELQLELFKNVAPSLTDFDSLRHWILKKREQLLIESLKLQVETKNTMETFVPQNKQLSSRNHENEKVRENQESKLYKNGNFREKTLLQLWNIYSYYTTLLEPTQICALYLNDFLKFCDDCSLIDREQTSKKAVSDNQIFSSLLYPSFNKKRREGRAPVFEHRRNLRRFSTQSVSRKLTKSGLLGHCAIQLLFNEILATFHYRTTCSTELIPYDNRTSKNIVNVKREPKKWKRHARVSKKEKKENLNCMNFDQFLASLRVLADQFYGDTEKGLDEALEKFLTECILPVGRAKRRRPMNIRNLLQEPKLTALYEKTVRQIFLLYAENEGDSIKSTQKIVGDTSTRDSKREEETIMNAVHCREHVLTWNKFLLFAVDANIHKCYVSTRLLANIFLDAAGGFKLREKDKIFVPWLTFDSFWVAFVGLSKLIAAVEDNVVTSTGAVQDFDQYGKMKLNETLEVITYHMKGTNNQNLRRRENNNLLEDQIGAHAMSPRDRRIKGKINTAEIVEESLRLIWTMLSTDVLNSKKTWTVGRSRNSEGIAERNERCHKLLKILDDLMIKR